MSLDEFELEQYRALRAEILRSMEDGNQIIGFGIAAIALVAHAGISSKESLFTIFVFALLVPLLSAVVVSMWFAAQERTARASYFLSHAERCLARAPEVTTWERWLRGEGDASRSRHFWSTEHAAFALFGTIVASSIAFSVTVQDADVHVVLRIATLAASLALCSAIAANLGRRFRRWKRWLSTSLGE